MELRTITYNYDQDGVLQNKVVGIFERKELESALNDIRGFYKKDNVKVISDFYDEDCDNYFLQFKNEENAWYYTSNYIVNELDL
jgi:hypothetical protein